MQTYNMHPNGEDLEKDRADYTHEANKPQQADMIEGRLIDIGRTSTGSRREQKLPRAVAFVTGGHQPASSQASQHIMPQRWTPSADANTAAATVAPFYCITPSWAAISRPVPRRTVCSLLLLLLLLLMMMMMLKLMGRYPAGGRYLRGDSQHWGPHKAARVHAGFARKAPSLYMGPVNPLHIYLTSTMRNESFALGATVLGTHPFHHCP